MVALSWFVRRTNMIEIGATSSHGLMDPTELHKHLISVTVASDAPSVFASLIFVLVTLTHREVQTMLYAQTALHTKTRMVTTTSLVLRPDRLSTLSALEHCMDVTCMFK